MTLFEEAIDRMLEAQVDMTRFEGQTYRDAMARRDRYKRAIVEAYAHYETKLLELVALTPPAVPIICATCRKPIQSNLMLGSQCDCTKGLTDGAR